jgi:hypothetical protein
MLKVVHFLVSDLLKHEKDQIERFQNKFQGLSSQINKKDRNVAWRYSTNS